MGAYAGCCYELGNDQGKMQPMSMIVHIAGVKNDDLEELYKRNPHLPHNVCVLNEMRRAGIEPSYTGTLIAPLSKENNLFSLMANHEYSVSSVDADDLTKATMHAREELFGYVQALRSLGGMWKDIHVVSSAAAIGVREGRRIKGKYYITREVDLLNGRIHDDGVCKVTYGVDIHQYRADSGREDLEKRLGIKAYPYEIPLRALIAQDVEGLMMAGRCISGDVYAHGNYRVGGNAARTGEAAGLAAAHSVLHNISLEETGKKIKELLEKH